MMMGFIPRDVDGVPLKETKAGTVVSIILSLASMGALSVCLSRRVQNVRDWSRLPLVCWLVLVIYVDSIAFVAGVAVLSNGFGIDSSHKICAQAVVLCLSCYMTTKFLYYFLVERAYIIRRSAKPRLKDKLYLFNSFGMLIPYCVVIALNFYFRFAIYEKGTCRIGMKRVAMIPLIGFDILVNVYLTSLFLIPLRGKAPSPLYSYKNDRNSQARTVALRTFIGSCCTLTSSVVNLTFVMVLNGEPGWICLMCCNVDIFFSVLVLHWITSKDNASTVSSQNGDRVRSFDNPTSPKRLVPRPPLAELAAYERGLHEWQKMTGVITVVTAKEPENGLSMDRISSIPPNVIGVETAHVREVSHMRPERLSIRSISDEQQSGKVGSTDDLFQRIEV
ncbi:hypothetical protein N431DRAFT_361713 [Stipitochalara longipes BDJ]|nr:hypothetical protein N431DRAFT_361713 [Stipitochalara longipes BDJ]